MERTEVMYCFVVLLAISLTATADNVEEFEKCKMLLKSHHSCCKNHFFNKSSIIEDNIKECMVMPHVPDSCERAICFGTKFGFATADGVINIDELQKHLEKKMSEHKDILEAVEEKCLDDDGYTLFGETDECDLNKMANCIHWQYLYRCPNFSEEERCKELKDIASKCQELEIDS